MRIIRMFSGKFHESKSLYIPGVRGNGSSEYGAGIMGVKSLDNRAEQLYMTHTFRIEVADPKPPLSKET